jgi:hypothetical protein
MIANSVVNFHESKSPHSLGLQQAMTIPSPGFDTNPLMINQKKYWGAGMGGLSFDGTGLLGTGLFSGDFTTWGWAELVFGAIGAYAVYTMFLQTRQVKARVSTGLRTRAKIRRGSKVARLRRQADELENDEGFF